MPLKLLKLNLEFCPNPNHVILYADFFDESMGDNWFWYKKKLYSSITTTAFLTDCKDKKVLLFCSSPLGDPCLLSKVPDQLREGTTKNKPKVVQNHGK